MREAAVSNIEAKLSWRRPGFELNVDLSLPGQGISVLLGPSGCGKTSVLRALAGLERARGSVRVGDAVWQDDSVRAWLPTHQRSVGMVFQEASLFPHLSVRENLLYGHRRVEASRRRFHLDQALALLGIEHLLQRSPQGLSGGERQRVAIARALLTSPDLLLMDEPLSALDPARKAEVLPYLAALGDSGVPIVYVTHSMEEAARLADHLVLMRSGSVEIAGPAIEVLARPDSPLARLDDVASVLMAQVVDTTSEPGLALLCCGDSQVSPVVLWVGASGLGVGDRVRVRVLARDVSVALSRAADSSILNIVPAHIDAMHPEDDASVMLRLALMGGAKLLARVTRRSANTLGLAPGMAVQAQIKGVALLGGAG